MLERRGFRVISRPEIDRHNRDAISRDVHAAGTKFEWGGFEWTVSNITTGMFLVEISAYRREGDKIIRETFADVNGVITITRFSDED